MKAYLFPGQGSQFLEMGKDLYKKNLMAKRLFQLANEVLDFKITSVMFEGNQEILKKTKYTQLAIYIYSVILSKVSNDFSPDMVAGHSLGEYSALASIGVFSFEDGLILVKERSNLMQKICDQIPGKMVVIFGLKDQIIENVCEKNHSLGVVVPSNYNAPGQLVISGEIHAIQKICFLLKKKGARKIFDLPVNGAFHSPIMKPIEKKFQKIINKISFKIPKCPIYQNLTGTPHIRNTYKIKKNLIKQLTHPVMWKQSIQNMIFDGAKIFQEIGGKKILKKMVKKILEKLKKNKKMME